MNELVTQPAMQQHIFPEGVKYSPGKFSATALLAIFFLYQIVGGGIALIIAGGEITKSNVALTRTATMVAQFLFLLLPTLWLIKHQHGTSRGVLLWRIPSTKEFILSVVGMVALLQVADGYMYFQEMIPLPENIKPFIELMKRMIEETYKVLVQTSTVTELIFVVIVVALTPAICEEVLFRGLVQKNISLATNRTKGFIITGIIFGLYHFNPFLAVPLVGLGIFFSFLQYRSQTIILPMIAHFVNNGVSVIGVYYYGYDQANMPTIISNDGSWRMILGSTIMFAVVFIIAMTQYFKATEHVVHSVEQPVTAPEVP
ncbi:MAG: CPBP family intramembrane metalloprotease [Bacteroidota bacterium]|nr:CPBP family intramembrane metalloprotease [Bacteroidota bacterium]